MAVTQISKIQIRRGKKENIPESLDSGEMALTTDTGELFIGAPEFEGTKYRTSYPYENIRVLTEFDVIHTLHDHVVTTGPLMRIDSPSVLSQLDGPYYLSYQANFPSAVSGIFVWQGQGPEPIDASLNPVDSVVLIRNNQSIPLPTQFVSLQDDAGSPNTYANVDVQAMGGTPISTVEPGDSIIVTMASSTIVGNIYPFRNVGGSTLTSGIVNLTWTNSGQTPGDLRGRVIQQVKITKASNGAVFTLPTSSVAVVHNVQPALLQNNSSILFDISSSGLTELDPYDIVNVNFLNLTEVHRYRLADTDSMVMDYSMVSDQMPSGLRARRTGTLQVVADEWSVGIVDNGVTINHTSNDQMRIVWSGRTEEINGEKIVILTCTNAGYYNVSVTFSGTRWKHSLEI